MVKELSWIKAADVIVRETAGLCSSSCVAIPSHSCEKRYRREKETVASTVRYLVQTAISNCPMSASRLVDHRGFARVATLPRTAGPAGVSI